MTYYIVGLGNPGEAYEGTRHNAGRLVLERLTAKPPEKSKFADWKSDKKLNAQKAEGKIGKSEVLLLLPETFMNASGKSVAPLVTSAKKAANLIVVQDDMDLPLGSLKISFNRGSAGHKGIESIVRAVKTKAFTRVRLGVCPTTPGGKLKKPNTDDKVLDFIIGPFKPAELETFKKVQKKAVEAVVSLVTEGRERAMNQFNS